MMIWRTIRNALGSGEPSVDQQKPWLLHIRSSKWFILSTIIMAVFTDIFLYAVIVPVVPFSLQERAGIPEDKTQSWVSVLVAVYGAALAVASPVCGWAADATPNRRMPLVIGLIALGGATVMLNLGRSIAVLIVGRVLQGFSAAVVWCVGLALVADTVNTDEIGECMGYVFTAMSVAMLSGPLLGGVVFDKGGYNAVFAMCYALIGIDIAMRMFMIEKKDAKKWEKLEQERLVTPTRTVETEGEKRTTTSPEGATSDSATQPPTEKDVVEDTNLEPALSVQSKKRVPAIITLIKSRRLLCALWATFVVATLMTQFDSVLPLFVEDTFGWGATAAGLIFLPLLVPSLLSPLIGAAIDRLGPRWFSVAGFIFFTPLEVLLRYVDHNSLRQKVLLCALLVLIGLALNFATPPLLVEIVYVVEQKEKDNPGLFGKKGAYAQGYGLFNVAWAAGCLVGPVWAGFVRDDVGWGTMTWSMALLSFVTAIPVGIWTGGSIFDKKKRLRRERGLSTAPASGQV